MSSHILVQNAKYLARQSKRMPVLKDVWLGGLADYFWLVFQILYVFLPYRSKYGLSVTMLSEVMTW